MLTRRRKSNNNNKTKKINNINKTRKRSKNRSINGGSKKKPEDTNNKYKNRWGKRFEGSHIERTVDQIDLTRALSQPSTAQYDISADIRRKDNTRQNTSIKAKLAKNSDYKGKPFEKTGKRSIDNADACRFLDALFHDPDPYELILIEYRPTPGHASAFRRLRFDLKALRPHIFRGIDEEAFYNSVQESSALIKHGKVEQGRRIANSLNNMLKQKGSSFRLNPKISSKITSGETIKGQKRLQCGLKFDFADMNIIKHVRELSSLSSQDSDIVEVAGPAIQPIMTTSRSSIMHSSAKNQTPKSRSASTARLSSSVAASARLPSTVAASARLSLLNTSGIKKQLAPIPENP